jgi:hypothetical protein
MQRIVTACNKLKGPDADPVENRTQTVCVARGREVSNAHTHSNCNIYPVTEDLKSTFTRQAYKTSFNRFVRHINFHDFQI